MRDSETTIKYSLFDLSKIRIYDEDGFFICEAKRVEAIHPLAAYKGAAQDHDALKVQIKQKKHHEKLTRQAAQGIINMQRSNMLRGGPLKFVFSLISNSIQFIAYQAHLF